MLSSGAQVRFDLSDASHVGQCRRAAQSLAVAHHFDETTAGRVAIVATELANNILRHAGSGQLLLQPVSDDGMLIELLAIDRGPGMSNVEQCLRDGYSTGGTPGTGLGAVRRLSRVFDVHSVVGEGTVVLARVGQSLDASCSGGTFHVGAISLPLRGEIECGDGWAIADDGPHLGVLIIDGLGHGVAAASAAQTGLQVYARHQGLAPADLMAQLHRGLAAGRGAAAACATLDAQGTMAFAGVGNIAGWVVSADRARGMMSHNGILGAKLLRIQEIAYEWPGGAAVVFHSDGVSGRWSMSNHPGLLQCHPAVIAATLYRDYGRSHDDVTVVVVKRR